jgi:hypothetical protein
VAPRRQKSKLPGPRNFPIGECDVLFKRKRPVEARVEVLEECRGDLSKAVELVQHPGEEGLVEHGGRQSIGDLVTRDVCDQYPGSISIARQLGRNPDLAVRLGLFDSLVEVVTMLEVEVDDMVAARRSVQKDRVALTSICPIRTPRFGGRINLTMRTKSSISSQQTAGGSAAAPASVDIMVAPEQSSVVAVQASFAVSSPA